MSVVTKISVILSTVFLLAGAYESVKLRHFLVESRRTASIVKPEGKSVFLPSQTTNDAIGPKNWRKPEVSGRGENWTFDLFTSPTIINEESQFVATLPWLEKTAATVNFEVVSVKRCPYPLQFSGFYQKPGAHEKDSNSLILRDLDTNETVLAEIGQYLEKYNVSIEKFDDKAAPSEKLPYRHPEITIHDKSLDRTLVLLPETVFYDDLYDIELRSKTNKKVEKLQRKGQKLVVENDEYILENVDFNNKNLEFSQTLGKDHFKFFLSF